MRRQVTDLPSGGKECAPREREEGKREWMERVGRRVVEGGAEEEKLFAKGGSAVALPACAAAGGRGAAEQKRTCWGEDPRYPQAPLALWARMGCACAPRCLQSEKHRW